MGAQQECGFTLIEVLIAIAIFAIVTVMLYSGLYGATKRLAVIDDAIEQSQNNHLVVATLRKLVAQTQPIFETDGNHRRLRFSGRRDEFNAVIPLPSHRGGPGLYNVTIQTRRGAAGDRVEMIYSPLVGAAYDEPESIAVFDSKKVEFSYYGRANDESPPNWSSVWLNRDRLPSLVRMELKGRDVLAEPKAFVFPLRLRFGPRQPQWVIHGNGT